MQDLIKVSDGLLHFQIGEQTISIDGIEAIRECNAITDRTKETTNFEYLDQFSAWVEKQTTIKLRPGQADSLWDAVHLEFSRNRKVFTDALKSLSSTESAPSA